MVCYLVYLVNMDTKNNELKLVPETDYIKLKLELREMKHQLILEKINKECEIDCIHLDNMLKLIDKDIQICELEKKLMLMKHENEKFSLLKYNLLNDEELMQYRQKPH